MIRTYLPAHGRVCGFFVVPGRLPLFPRAGRGTYQNQWGAHSFLKGNIMEDRLLAEGNRGSTLKEATLGHVGFDLAEWVQGRELATRSVRIYGALGLYGEREQLGHELEAARAAEDADLTADLKARIAELTVQMQEDIIDFKLQALTQSRRVELMGELQESDEEDPETLALMMVAEYVVEPVGVTVDALLGLADWDPVQANELVAAMNQLNSQVPNIGATRPF